MFFRSGFMGSDRHVISQGRGPPFQALARGESPHWSGYSGAAGSVGLDGASRIDRERVAPVQS
eukprot:1646740-Amphidinium_carterae.1